MAKGEIKFPNHGRPPSEVLEELEASRCKDLKWQEGKSFCLIYYPGEKYAKPIQEAYNLFFTENALNPTSFPSLRKAEAEVIRMMCDLYNGGADSTGSMTSGGTESILMAVKTARDWAKAEKGIDSPEIIIPKSAHPAFNKAFHYFGIKGIIIECDLDYKANIKAIKEAITTNTIMLVGSAPSYPHGVIDNLSALGSIAHENNILFHVDACFGGMILPFAKEIGLEMPPFDFSIQGVTSISIDLHKYGYAAKGASVILYHSRKLRKHQFSIYTSWPGGIYGSPAVSGSKPGGSIAAAWAALQCIGKNGYIELTREAFQVKDQLQRAVEEIPELTIIGSPNTTVVAFKSDKLNVFELADKLNEKGWHFERLQDPSGLHFTCTPQHKAVIDAFIRDLNIAVESTKKFKLSQVATTIKIETIKRLIKLLPEGVLSNIQKQFSGGAMPGTKTAPMYGMMGALQGTGDLDEIILDILDKLNDIE